MQKERGETVQTENNLKDINIILVSFFIVIHVFHIVKHMFFLEFVEYKLFNF